MKIKSIKKIEKPDKVYNIECENNHNYFANGNLVSNCHSAKALSIQAIAKNCVNAKYRIGYTGTLNTSECDKMTITGYIGPCLFKMKSNDLIDRGILSKIKIANILLKYPEDVINKNKNRPYEEEVRTINEYEDRNKVFDWIFSNIKDGENTLILCTQISHLEKLQKYLEEKLDDKYLIENIYGKTDVEEREHLRKLMDTEKNMILIGTYATMATGINIKRLHNIIFASSYKSKIKVLQGIGRGLRKHEDKDGMILWDLVDDLVYTTRNGTKYNNYVYEHWLERMKYYEESGFKTFNKSFKL
jgi:superfamily II DNA or RNA helicase